MNIRNFSIIAHIDHGKSTLADRIIELCGGLSDREMTSQVLDTLELEKERGITIKSQTVNLEYKAEDGQLYQFNLIDTPGHVDFSYEVSRSLSACEGAILLVDASQGVEAQTLSTCYNAVEEGLTIIPVLNKIDLAQSDPERIKKEIETKMHKYMLILFRVIVPTTSISFLLSSISYIILTTSLSLALSLTLSFPNGIGYKIASTSNF